MVIPPEDLRYGLDMAGLDPVGLGDALKAVMAEAMADPMRMMLWSTQIAGLRAKAITVLGECTACTQLRDGRRKYFSHRAESGYTGRMMGVVGVSLPHPGR